ncbi:cation:proton antiporter domain-containing protein [Zavarzinia sp. CC-PAN008]|uniref:cation:proton antiporter domain-containing protein n=1 Tax=Zavarzinia sp. CC-PAN008 TaxID=3243332 RepID=UPI003F7464F6
MDHHDFTLISTVAMGFVLAFIFGFIANRLRLPPLVGYLVAGIAVGPFTPGFVADAGLSGQLAEMGVIMLMFGVGLHFSMGDLMAVRWIAVPGAIGQIAVGTAIGAGVAHLWGWSLGSGLVFGLSLSVASTVVLLRALEDRNELTTPYGRIAVGWLIVEDLVMVLALVLLPALAEILGPANPSAAVAAAADGHAVAHGAGDSLWMTILVTLAKVGAFVALAVILGPRLVPAMLKQVARTGSRELFTLAVLALALGIAYGSAELFGVSFALGAFFAGVVLSESDFSHKAAQESLPLQDAFAILFFVSVGMLFDPSILIRDPLAVLAVVAIIVIGKSLAALAIVLALGYPLSAALTVSAALAQIGEFSFILAGFGVVSGLLLPEARDYILAGALLSITLNSAVFYGVDRVMAWINADPKRREKYARFGQRRMVLLRTQMAELSKRNEERAAEKSMKSQTLVDRFPIFAELDEEAREDLLLLLEPRKAAPGEKLIRKGERADRIYFIAQGAVQVAVGGRTIRLEAGNFFGEMALISGARRSADVTAIDYCEFHTLDRRDFRSLVVRHPVLKQRMDAYAASRTAQNMEAAAAAGATPEPA